MTKSIDQVNQSTASGDDVMELLHAVVHGLRSRHHQALQEAEPGLTPMDARVLHYFARHPGKTQTDLAAHSGRDKGQLARLVQGLRERGLVDGEPDPADRRSLRLTLTPSGREMHQRLHRRRQRVGQLALRGLAPDELDALAALLRRLQGNLQPD